MTMMLRDCVMCVYVPVCYSVFVGVRFQEKVLHCVCVCVCMAVRLTGCMWVNSHKLNLALPPPVPGCDVLHGSESYF